MGGVGALYANDSHNVTGGNIDIEFTTFGHLFVHANSGKNGNLVCNLQTVHF